MNRTCARKVMWELRRNRRLLLELLEARLAPATFSVSTTQDTVAANLSTGVDSSGHISLRSAIQATNNLGGSNSINLPAGTYDLTITGAGEDAAASGDLDIKSNLTISATGVVVINAHSIDRVFQIFSGFSLTAANLTIQNGVAQGGNGGNGAGGGGGGAGLGGGIFNDGTVTLIGVTLTGDTARGGNGGAGVGAADSGFGGGGGGGAGGNGAANSGTAGGVGGAPNGGAANSGDGGDGGGGGGGLGSIGGNDGGMGGFGAGGGGGGSSSSAIRGGAGGSGGDGGFGGGGGGGAGGAQFSGSGGTAGFGAGAGGSGADGGGGGGAGFGGAIFNRSGTLTMTNCTLAGNTAAGGSGAASGGGNGSAYGGGVFNYDGTVTIVNSTLASNVLLAGSGAAAGGGAIYNVSVGPAFVRATVNLTNSILANTLFGFVDLVNNGLGGTATVNTTTPNIVESRTNSGGAVTNAGGIIATDPGLAALADNGGPTKTMALLTAAAINVGTAVGAPAVDQRGLPRDSQPDLGAYELQPIVVNSTSDNTTTDGLTTLREAILAANATPAIPDTIKFGPSVAGGKFDLSLAGDSTTSLGPSALSVTSAITILGTGETIEVFNERAFLVTSSGSLTLQDLTVSGGSAAGGRGGDGVPAYGGGGGGAGLGGGILNEGTLTLSGVTLSNNKATGGNGGEANTSPTYPASGNGGAGGDSGDGAAGAFGVGGGGGQEAFDGGSGGFGGGGGGGGGDHGVAGMAGFGGGNGVAVGTGLEAGGGGGGGAGLGGAIFNDQGTVTLTNCTLADNAASGGAGGRDGANDGLNGQDGSGFGGGVFNLNGAVSATNCTFGNNSAAQGGGGIYNLSTDFGVLGKSAGVTLVNSIVADSADGVSNLVNRRLIGNPLSVFTAQVIASAPNLVEGGITNSGGFIVGSPLTSDPMLRDLADYGGPTQTMALLSGSPAVNQANSAAPATDQRGRPRYGPPDLGAYERDLTSPTVTINQAVGQADPTSSSPVRFDIVFSEPVINFNSVTLGGTAGATTYLLTGSGANYSVAVSGINSSGTVIVTISAGAATDPDLNNNVASTSTDNQVTVQALAPATINVTTNTNVVDAPDESTISALLANPGPDGFLSLREAIIAANATITAGANTIVLEDATYTLALADNSWYGVNGLPPIASQIVIAGNGAIIERDAAGPNFRFFFVSGGQFGLAAGSLTLEDLTLRGGVAHGGNGAKSGGGGGAGMGGAIFNAGTLSVLRVTQYDNAARGGKGGDALVQVGGGGGGGMATDAFGISGGGPNGGAYVGAAGGEGGGGAGGFFQAGAGGFGGGGGGSPGTGNLAAGQHGGEGGFGGGGGGPGRIDEFTNQPTFTRGGFGGGFSDVLGDYGGGGGGFGGAIFNRGGAVSITNSTITGNTAAGGAGGGGGAAGGRGIGGAVFNLNGNVTLLSSTIAGNIHENDGSFGQGAVFSLAFAGSATLSITNCILAGTTGGLDAENELGAVTGDHNIIVTNRSVPASVIVSAADPQLGPLANSGGLTPTMALLAGSSAIDTGTATGAPATDQRGAPRINAVDIGSYEFVPNQPPTCLIARVPTATDEAGPQTVASWLTNSVAGPPYESQQVVSVSLSVDKPELFAVQPTVDGVGAMHFTPAANVRGTATLTVTLKDDGGTASGGVDTKVYTQTIEIDKPHPWHNVLQPLDVTGSGGKPDGHISPNDALAIINYINAFGSSAVPAGAAIGSPFGFLDTTASGGVADSFVAPNDALAVINAINAGFSGEGEGQESEAESQGTGVSGLGGDSELMMLLAMDIASQPRQRL